MTAAEPLADRPHVAAIFLEHDEIILRMIGDEVDASVATLSQRMRIDHRSDRRVGLGPFHVHAIASGAVTNDHAIRWNTAVLTEDAGREKDETDGEAKGVRGHDANAYGLGGTLQSGQMPHRDLQAAA